MINKTISKEEYITKGYILRIDIPIIEVDKFAMVILTLINHKSSQSRETAILEIKTYLDSNTIDITFDGEDVIESKSVKYLEMVLKMNTNGEEFKIESLGEIEVVNISLGTLEDDNIIKDYSSAYVRGEI